MAKKYIVDLTEAEKAELVKLTQERSSRCQKDQASKYSAFGE